MPGARGPGCDLGIGGRRGAGRPRLDVEVRCGIDTAAGRVHHDGMDRSTLRRLRAVRAWEAGWAVPSEADMARLIRILALPATEAWRAWGAALAEQRAEDERRRPA